jgi:hypothetical protein
MALGMGLVPAHGGTQLRFVDAGRYASTGSFHRACLGEGLSVVPRGSMNVSMLMDDEAVAEIVAAWRRALGRVLEVD